MLNQNGGSMRKLRVALSQINLKVGDLTGNRQLIIQGIEKAVADGADVVVFPELAVTGYPPEDLVFGTDFINANLETFQEIVRFTTGKDILALVGFINRSKEITNSVGIVYNGRVIDVYDKIYLPNYGVFDEKRYFYPGREIPVYEYKNVLIGVNICEDIWYPLGPAHHQAVNGAEVLLNISASPYHRGKQEYREKMYSTRAGDEAVFLVNVNMVGGQDELVFDGGSTAYDSHGNLIARLKQFSDDYQAFDLNVDKIFRYRLKDIRRRDIRAQESALFKLKSVMIETVDKIEASGGLKKGQPAAAQPETRWIDPQIETQLTLIESVHRALVLGTRDYTNKNGFEKVIIAISGGIDSALVAAVAVEALGAERVKGIYLPSQYSADISGTDAKKLCDNLGIGLLELPIKDLFDNYMESLDEIFAGTPFGTAEENLQSRIRGNIVMALSNKLGWLVLTTGNKSEMSTGYATLYGDMAGGFAVIKDVVKTLVYELANHINRDKEVIPQRIIDRPPSAELRPDQKDTDSLPPYDVLDRIIRGYVEEDLPMEEIVREVGDPELVRKFVRLIDRNEYKRRQAPPGVKITARAFGRDRRMPITNGFK